MMLNNNNFVVFGDSGQDTTIDNGYLARWRQHTSHIRILTNDTFTIITNFKETPPSSNFKVVLDGTVINDASQYSISTTPIGLRNFKVTLSIPATHTNYYKCFRIGLVDGSDNIISLSNTFVSEKVDDINGTMLFRFKHNTDIFGYEWESLGDDDFYTIRLRSNMVGYAYPKEDAIYRSATSGRTRRTRAVIDKKYTIETYYFTEQLHDGFNTLVHSKQTEINGIAVTVDGEYKPNFTRTLNINSGTIDVFVKDYSERLNNCDI